MAKDPSVPDWRSIVDFALKSPNSTVQEAAADAMASVSKLVECSSDVNRYVYVSSARFLSG